MPNAHSWQRIVALLVVIILAGGDGPDLRGDADSASVSAAKRPSLLAAALAPDVDALRLSLPWAPGETWALTGGPHGRPVRNALDFAALDGVGQVRAAHEGIAFRECPNTVRIDHVSGFSTLYAHIENIAVESGQPVARGQLLGTTASGTSCSLGDAEGDHLHFAVLKDNQPYDIQGLAIGGWLVHAGPSAYTGCLSRDAAPGQECPAETEMDVFNDGTTGRGGSGGCAGPDLREPAIDAVSRSRTITFVWRRGKDCPDSRYEFRIKTVPDMVNGGATLVDLQDLADPRLTQTIGGQAYTNRDLYWGVKATAVPDASWTVRRFSVRPSLDGEAPIIVWKAPYQQDEAILPIETGPVILRVSATDAIGVKQVEFVRWDRQGNRVGLGTLSQPSIGSEYAISIHVPSLDLNWNRIAAIASDAAGNQASSHIWLFRLVPGGAPVTVEIKRPSSGESVATDQAPIAIVATDNVGSQSLLRVEYQIDGGPFQPTTFAPALGRYRAAWDTTRVPDGPHRLRARVTDLAGRSVFSPPVDVLVDNINRPPVADAGPDVTVVDSDNDGRGIVELDASGSRVDPELTARYEWYEYTGTTDVLLGVGERLTYSFGLAGHVVRLKVIDSRGQRATDDTIVTVDFPDGAPNDDMAEAQPVSTLPFVTFMHIEKAHVSPDDPAACVPMRRTVWYSYTPPASENIVVTTQDSSFDSGLAVFSGERGQLRQIACTDQGWDSRVSFRAEAGTTYYFMIGSVGPRDGGFFELHLLVGYGNADTTKPSIWWISPVVRWDSVEDSVTVKSPTVLLSAWARDLGSGIARVQFGAFWSGEWHFVASVEDPSGPETYSYRWDMCAAGVPDGDVALGLQAYDVAGNETLYSHQWTNTHFFKKYQCTVDEDPPTVRFESPVKNGNEYRISDGEVALQVDVTDNVGVEQVVLERLDAGGQVVPIATFDQPPYRSSIGIDFLHLGPNTVTAIAFDANGNITERSIQVVREPVPRPEPRVSLSPGKGRVEQMVTATLAGFPADAPIALLWDGNQIASSTASDAGLATVTFRVPAATAGRHVVRASVGTSSAESTFTVTPSVALPTVTAPRGRRVEIELRGFAAGASIAVNLAPDAPRKPAKRSRQPAAEPRSLTTITADARGTATVLVRIPLRTEAGNYFIAAIDSRQNRARARLSVVSAARAGSSPTAASTADVSDSGSSADANGESPEVAQPSPAAGKADGADAGQADGQRAEEADRRRRPIAIGPDDHRKQGDRDHDAGNHQRRQHR